ncbi:hypothetical protein ACIGCZ_35345 [Streptomyces nigra]|uniref:hypothetical protein n=1 Tax=Streptomyces nigra TaxID=1827580 RepID=UPI003451E8EF
MRIDTAGMSRMSGSGPVETPRTRWLVGLPFRSAARTVRCYYVVTDADDGAHAVRVALKRAERERQSTELGRQLAPGAPIEVQRILSDSLGNTSLTSRCPGCGGRAYPIRACLAR